MDFWNTSPTPQNANQSWRKLDFATFSQLFCRSIGASFTWKDSDSNFEDFVSMVRQNNLEGFTKNYWYQRSLGPQSIWQVKSDKNYVKSTKKNNLDCKLNISTKSFDFTKFCSWQMLLVFNFQKSNDELEWDCIENPQRKLNCTILHEFDASPLKLLHSVKNQFCAWKIFSIFHLELRSNSKIFWYWRFLGLTGLTFLDL